MTNGALDGLLFCGNILVPSLFPFMVLSSFLIYSGLSYYIAKPFNGFTSKILNLPSITFTCVLLSMIGGFPVGAKGIRSLLDEDKIDENTARQMLCFCVGAGPAFVVIAVGTTLLNSLYYGLVLFFSQLFSQLILAIVSGIVFNKKNIYVINKKTPPTSKNNLNFSSALVKSCSDSVTGILNLCGMVVLFSAFMGIINNTNINTYIKSFLSNLNIPTFLINSILPLILEVTSFCSTAIKDNSPLAFISFGIGFGGLCVHFQVFQALGNLKYNKKLFFLCRFIQGFISLIITYISLKIYNPAPVIDVFSNITKVPTYTISSTLLGSIALIFTSICFIFVSKFCKKNKSII